MKKTIKLTLLVCLALFACALVFTACDSDSDLQTPTQAETTTSHEHKFGNWQIATKPTCKQEGTETRKCNGCDETETRTTSKLDQHSTMHGVCAFCGDFVGMLSEEWDIIRVANNDIAQLKQQISLQITLGGDLNIDKCNELFAKIEIISNELAKYPNEFADFSNHFALLLNEWSVMADKVNDATTKNLRITAWEIFSKYYTAWQKEYFTISIQYYPPNQ